MEICARISLLICGIAIIIFGIFHIFIPKIAKWEKYNKLIPDSLFSSISLNNFVLSTMFLFFGIQLLFLTILFWNNSLFIILILALGFVLIFVRIIYELKNPLKIKNNIIFRFFTLFLLLLIAFPLFYKVYKIIKTD